MIPAECKLHRYFARWEFNVEHVLCDSDVEGYPLDELLSLADADSLSRWNTLTLGYTETAGHPLLREVIAEQYDKVKPDEIIVCGGGADEALFVTTHALLGPGTHAVVVWPAYESLYNVAAMAGAEVTLVSLNAGAGWILDLDAVREAIRPETRVIFVSFPHNPTGTLPDHTTFDALVSLAQQRDIRIVSDEVFRFMEYDPVKRLPAAADLDERAISIGVMSKAYGLAGLRIGWIACPDRKFLQDVLRIKDYTSVCAAGPSEILALMALRAREHVLGRCMKIVTDNLVHVDAFIDRWPDLFEWVRPQAGTVGFPLLRSPTPVDRFVKELLKQESVLLLPDNIFNHPDNRFRIGFGRKSLPEALERLSQFTSRYLA
jgi:aspartate/methionine/tyrosine aminotransferase